MTTFKSKLGEVKTKDEWQQELNEFWEYVERQNRYICRANSTVNKRSFKKPDDAFERYVKLLGLEKLND